jgi:hypothetical protein
MNPDRMVSSARSSDVCVISTDPDANSPPYIDNTSCNVDPMMFEGYHLLDRLENRLATNLSVVSFIV